MRITLPPADGMRRVPGGYLPIWQCIHCQTFQTLEGYGTRLMNGPQVREGLEEPDWRRQSWCMSCRLPRLSQHLINPHQPILPDLFGSEAIEAALDDQDDLPAYLSDDGFGRFEDDEQG